MTEAITKLHHGHVSDEVYSAVAQVFSERELGQVIAMAVTINAGTASTWLRACRRRDADHGAGSERGWVGVDRVLVALAFASYARRLFCGAAAFS